MPNSGLSLVVDRLACPVCGNSVALTGAIVHCPVGHGFDVARQGYVSLFGGGARAHTGDDRSMVTARERFLERGLFAPIAEAVSEAIPAGSDGLCVDLAGGTGYHLGVVLDAHPGLVGLDLDLSTVALKRAALKSAVQGHATQGHATQGHATQGHGRMAAVAADVWQPLPIRSGSAAFVLSIFGPRNAPEIQRILREDGLLIVVTPTVRHLAELVEGLGLVTVDPRKQERLDASLHEISRRSVRVVEYTVGLGRDGILDSILMGPSAHHITPDALNMKVSAPLDPLTVTVSVTISVYARTS